MSKAFVHGKTTDESNQITAAKEALAELHGRLGHYAENPKDLEFLGARQVTEFYRLVREAYSNLAGDNHWLPDYTKTNG